MRRCHQILSKLSPINPWKVPSSRRPWRQPSLRQVFIRSCRRVLGITTRLVPGFALLLPLFLTHPIQAEGIEDLPAGPWVYLRAEVPISAAEDLVEVIVVGDVMPGRRLAGVPGLFDQVAPALQAADLAVGNLEGVMAPGAAGGFASPLSIPGEAALSLSEAGFGLLSLANNHALDAGPEGLAQTIDHLQVAGIQPLENGRLGLRQVRGLVIGFLAWNEIPYPDRTVLFDSLAAARAKSDILIVLVHWGQEYQRNPILAQRDLAGKLLEAGADVIVGAHPHVVQDLEVNQPQATGERASLVAYSLGNFVFDQGWDDTRQGLALRLFFDHAGLRAAQALPLWTVPRARWMTPEAASALLARILPPARIGFTCDGNTCRTIEVPQGKRSGLFWSGAVDLTGDGPPEIVRRQGQVVVVYQQGQLAWRSPPEWHVLDLALGDPNEDGRYELLLVLEKTDLAGNRTTHPFVIGYRGGIYRQLWGGSPVADRLYEVELADLDGDGVTELVMVEASEDGAARCLTLWRWHGWGFNLVWRSPLGNYRDLIVLPAGEGLPTRLSVSVGP